MFLPIGDAPNPKGVPIVTYALIAVNVAAFLLLNVPLESRRADVRSPEFREYVEVMARELQGRVDVRELVARTSAYDLFSFEQGGVDENGHADGRFICNGIRPRCADRIEHRGISLPSDLFLRRVIET